MQSSNTTSDVNTVTEYENILNLMTPDLQTLGERERELELKENMAYGTSKLFHKR